MIRTTEDLLDYITLHGTCQGAVVADGCYLYDLSSVTSLSGLTLGDRCRLYDLSSVTSLSGLTLGEGCRLHDLSSVTSLSGLTLDDGCDLHGLSSVTSLSGLTLGDQCYLYGLSDDIDLSDIRAETTAEVALLDAIPRDRLDMSGWHCGTSHCLAGWAQVISDRLSEDVLTVGCELLPSVDHLFYAPTAAVQRWLDERQYA